MLSPSTRYLPHSWVENRTLEQQSSVDSLIGATLLFTSLSGISEEPYSDGAVTRHGDDPCLARAVVAEGLAVRAQEDQSIDVVRAGFELVDYLCKMIKLNTAL